MSERDVVSQYNEQKVITTDADHTEFKLPTINNSNSRLIVRSRLQRHQDSSIILPVPAKKGNSSQERSPMAKRNPPRMSSKQEKDQFTLQIEERLKRVLEKVNQVDGAEGDPSLKQEKQFEQAIKYNRQKIKLHKHLLKDQVSTRSQHQSPAKRNSPPKIKKADRVEGILRHIKEYSEHGQNLYISNKKENVRVKVVAQEEVNDLSKDTGNRRPYKQHKTREAKSQKQPKHQAPKAMVKRRVSANIFDGIHAVLQQPRNRASSMLSKSQHRTIEQLQHKINEINSRMGVNTREKTKQTEENSLKTQNIISVRDWKRLSYRGHSFQCVHDSSFERQMERISELQVKNDRAINRYIQHQQMLLELGILRKRYPEVDSKTR